MRILITNDDGIHAEGLAVLEQIARALSDDVWVVAPETEQSGVSHSLSLNDPLRLRELGRAPLRRQRHADRLRDHGTRQVMADEKPDLVLSGVNRGRNVAEDVTYSGTVAGAIEGTVLGVPAIALSQAYAGATKRQIRIGTPRQVRARSDPQLLAAGIPRACWSTSTFPTARRTR